MRPMRCSDRFVLEGTLKPEPEMRRDTPIVGVWTGRVKRRKMEWGMRLESVNEQGAVLRGRYCRRWPARGTFEIFDIDPGKSSWIRTEPDRRTAKMTTPFRNERDEHTITINEDDTMEIAFETNNRNVGGVVKLQRGHREKGCLQRTTPAPALRSRPISQGVEDEHRAIGKPANPSRRLRRRLDRVDYDRRHRRNRHHAPGPPLPDRCRSP